MPYLGTPPQSGFITSDAEKITGQTTNYVNLSNAISSLDDVQVHVNYVIQDPSTLTFTSTTRIGLGDTLVSSDVVLITYLGKSVATQSPPVGGVSLDMLSATGTKSSSTFLRGDNTFASAGITGIDSSADATAITIDSSENVNIGDATNRGFSPLQLGNTSDNHAYIQMLSSVAGNIHFGDATSGAGLYPGSIVYRHDEDIMKFVTNGAEQVRIHTNGVMSAADGIALGVGTANTASNVLNDYEEGSWVPNWASQGGSVTGSSGVTGTYIKIGKQVTLTATGVLTTNSASTNYKFSNAPFQANGHSTGIGHEYGQTGTAQIVWIDDNSSQVNLKGYAGAMIQNPYLRLTITYFTD